MRARDQLERRYGRHERSSPRARKRAYKFAKLKKIDFEPPKTLTMSRAAVDGRLMRFWLWQVGFCTLTAASFTPAGFLSGMRVEQSFVFMNEAQEGRGRVARKKQEFEQRRDAWLARYGSIKALQSTFGKGPPWGDLSPEQTRSLYHTLLPRSLLGLHESGLMRPEELAPLAYEARIAAKGYARSRCVVTGRLVTAAFDQYRSLRDRGRLAAGSGSLSWEEIWQKYEGQIVQEECAAALNGSRRSQQGSEALSMQIYLRILEKSCATNQAFDSLFLKENPAGTIEKSNLTAIALQLDEDVRAILLRPKDGKRARRKIEKAQKKQRVAGEKEQQAEQRVTSKLQKARAKAEMKRRKVEAKKEEERNEQLRRERRKQRARRREEEREEYANRGQVKGAGAGAGCSAVQKAGTPPTASQRREVLRVLGRTRRQFRLRSSALSAGRKARLRADARRLPDARDV